MKPIRKMSQPELAAFVQSKLKEAGITAVLSGGAAVTFYSHARYVSKDLDLINANFAKRSKIHAIMESLGFHEQGRYFVHGETGFFVEFPDGPLSVGEESVKEVQQHKLPTGNLYIISPTDCVKDRLCAFYFWNDRQGLAQAILVAEEQDVDLKEIQRWSKTEGKLREYRIFEKKLGREATR